MRGALRYTDLFLSLSLSLSVSLSSVLARVAAYPRRLPRRTCTSGNVAAEERSLKTHYRTLRIPPFPPSSSPPPPAPSAGRHGDAAARLGQSDPIDLRPIARTVQLFCNQRFRGRVSFCTHRAGRRSFHASDVNRVRSFVEAHRSA